MDLLFLILFRSGNTQDKTLSICGIPATDVISSRFNDQGYTKVFYYVIYGYIY